MPAPSRDQTEKWRRRKTAYAAGPRGWNTVFEGPRPPGLVKGGRFFVHCTTATILLQDGAEDGSPGIREQGRWTTSCVMHGARAWWKTEAIARMECLLASFCETCWEASQKDQFCPRCCGWPRPCALCEDDETEVA